MLILLGLCARRRRRPRPCADVSSLAGSLSARRPRAARALAASRASSADAALTVVAVALAIAAVAFGADGGLRLERTTWTEVGADAASAPGSSPPRC